MEPLNGLFLAWGLVGAILVGLLPDWAAPLGEEELWSSWLGTAAVAASPHQATLVSHKCYQNAETDKSLILSENKGKSGIYMWVNTINGKRYIGSSVDLHRRFSCYYSVAYLEIETKKNNSIIYKALIKFGYLKFSLEILEYCEPKDVIKREQHYLNILKPEYNILKTAGSVLGLKHTEEIRAKIREASLGNKNMLGKTHTEETKAQIREAQKGNNSRLGKTHTE